MDPQETPEKRFELYQEVFDAEGVPIGFTLPGSDFLFKFDAEKGWKDEKGNHYNSKGVLQKIADGISDNDSEDIADEDELDQFERMLDDEPCQSRKPKPESVTTEKESKEEDKVIGTDDYKSQSIELLNQYTKNERVREGLPAEVHIFFKMRTKFYERIQPQVEKAQSVTEINEFVKKIKIQIEEKAKKLKEKNPWINQNVELEYSGTQLDEATYDRYWYGTVKTSADKYSSIIEQIEKSEQFALLDHKTFYALKSKFYLKKKMQQTIKELASKVEGLEPNSIVKITADNLPQNFPISFILDLFSFSGTPLDQVEGIKIVDDFKAQIHMSKTAALKFLNVEGYCHDEKEYIELEVEADQAQKVLSKEGLFKLSVNTSKKNPYKAHTRQLYDTLAIEKSKQGLAKLFTEEEESSNGGYRLIVGLSSLKKLLMFRGASLDVLQIQAFHK